MSITDRIKHRDRMVSFITEKTDKLCFRLSMVRATHTVQDAIRRHQLNPLSALLLGELLIGAALSTYDFKANDTISLKMKSEGPLGLCVAESNGAGEIRGYLSDQNLMLDGDDRTDIKSRAIGGGTLEVTKWVNGEYNSHGVVELIHASIVKDLTEYYARSMQVPTALKIDISLNEDYSVSQAAGILLQALPGAKEDWLKKMEETVNNMPPLTELLEQQHTETEAAQMYFADFNLKEVSRKSLDFYCRCNKNSYAARLLTLGRDELSNLAIDGEQTIRCHYCNESYLFSREEINELAQKVEEIN